MASYPRKDAAPFIPAEARHFDLVNNVLQLNNDELDLLAEIRQALRDMRHL